MIDTLKKVARRLQPLRLPALIIGAVSTVTFLATILLSDSVREDRYLIPALIGLLWSLSTYFFIQTFSRVPPRVSADSHLFEKLKMSLIRGWYWLVGAIFLGTTFAVFLTTVRLLVIWLVDYSG